MEHVGDNMLWEARYGFVELGSSAIDLIARC